MEEIRYEGNKITKITSSAIMLSVIFILSFFTRFIKFSSFLSFNFSFIFVYLTYRYISKRASFLIAFLNMIISPAISTEGYEMGSILGNFILFLSIILFLFSMHLSQFLIPNKGALFTLFRLSFSIVLTSIIITILNIFIFTSLFLYIYGILNSFSYLKIVERWNELKPLFFNFDSYFIGAGITYFSFNVINLSINCFFIILLQTPIMKIFSFKF